MIETSMLEGSINNDFLSQSYLQGIERISGTKNHNFDFKIPEEILEAREKTWNSFFDKYHEEASDDIELNVVTLEPAEEVSEEEYCYGQRIPMRTPASLVQYWINTGNSPYKALLNENEVSENGSSISEKEDISPLRSLLPVNENHKQKYRSDSSYSSVDTAAYILSNTNITKKTNTIAIIEGAKCTDIKSSKNIYIKDVETVSNDKIKDINTVEINRVIHDGSNVKTNIPDTELYPKSVENMSLKIVNAIENGQPIINAAISNAVQSNMLQNSSCKKVNTIDVLNSRNQRNLDVRNIADIVSIFQQFDETSKRLSDKTKADDSLDEAEVLEKEISNAKQISENEIKVTKKDTNLSSSQRKKLYTGRDSPIDLILTNRHSINRLSEAKYSLHPALDPDCTIQEKTSLLYKSKNKHLSVLAKKNIGFKKGKRKGKRSSIYRKQITETSNEDFIVDCASKTLSSFQNNSNSRDNISSQQNNDTNISIENKTYKPDLASVDLNPIVRLEHITPCYKRHESKFVKNNHMQKNNVHNNKHSLHTSKKLYICKTLDSQSIGSSESTILICKCNENTSQGSHASTSDCSLNLRLSADDSNFSDLNARKKSDKLLSLKNTDMTQKKEPYIVLKRLSLLNKNSINTTNLQVLNYNDSIQQKKVLNKSKIHSNSCGTNKTANVNLREIKIVLEQLPLPVNKNCTDTVKSQILNKNGAIQQKEALKKSEASSNSYRTNNIDNIKFQQVKVVLDRLPANVCLKRSSNVTDINASAEKKKTLLNATLNNNKRDFQIETKTLANENVEISNRTICKADNEIIAEHGKRVFDEVKSNFTFQHKNEDSKISQNNYKCSILNLTSDEDDFDQLLQCRKNKRLKMSIDKTNKKDTVRKNLCDDTNLVNTTKDKYYGNGNLSTVIYSSKKTPKKVNGLVRTKNNGLRERKKSSEVEIKSFDNSTTSLTSSQMRKNKRFLFFQNEDDNDTHADEHKRKEKTSFLDCNRDIGNSSEGCSNKIIRRNGTDSKADTRIIFLQTETFYTDSSNSDSNNYATSTRKALKRSSIHDKSRYNNNNKEKLFNSSIPKKFTRKYSSSLNSSTKGHDAANQLYNIKIRSATSKEAKASNHLANEEFNDINLKSSINNPRKNMSSSVNDIQATAMQKETLLSNFIRESRLTNSSENKQIMQQDNIKSTKKKLLMYQTKSYYSDSSVSS